MGLCDGIRDQEGHAISAPRPPGPDQRRFAHGISRSGKLGRKDSMIATEEQTEIAIFWEDDLGTVTPPGHWNEHRPGNFAIERGATRWRRTPGYSPTSTCPLGRRGDFVLGDQVYVRILAADHRHPPHDRTGRRCSIRRPFPRMSQAIAPSVPPPHASLIQSFGTDKVSFSHDFRRICRRHAQIYEHLVGRRGSRHEPNLRRHPLAIRQHRGAASGPHPGRICDAQHTPTATTPGAAAVLLRFL